MIRKILLTIFIIPFALLAYVIGIVFFPVIIIGSGIITMIAVTIIEYFYPDKEQRQIIKSHFAAPHKLIMSFWK